MSTLSLQLEYALDKLHDVLLEAEILNIDTETDIHSRCECVIDLLSRIYNSQGDNESNDNNSNNDENFSLNIDTKLIGLLSKYSNIFDSNRKVYKDIDNLLQLFENYTTNNNNNSNNNNNGNSENTQLLIKKVRFDNNNNNNNNNYNDNDMDIGTITNKNLLENVERTFKLYHDNVETNDNQIDNNILIDSSHEQSFNYSQQRSVLQSQDIQLDNLSQSVNMANSMSRQMGDEIEAQNDQLLPDLEANLDHNQRRLNQIVNHKILRNEHKEQDRLCLVILILVLVLLFLLIVL